MTVSISQQRGIGYFLLRVLYFIFVGLWLSGVWATIAWVLSITIIGLPVGLWMLNRLPQVTTLKPERSHLMVSSTGEVWKTTGEQYPFVLRAIYFLLIGWWFSGLWLFLAWTLSSTIIGLPFSFWMIDRVPFIITLARM